MRLACRDVPRCALRAEMYTKIGTKTPSDDEPFPHLFFAFFGTLTLVRGRPAVDLSVVSASPLILSLAWC